MKFLINHRQYENKCQIYIVGIKQSLNLMNKEKRMFENKKLLQVILAYKNNRGIFQKEQISAKQITSKVDPKDQYQAINLSYPRIILENIIKKLVQAIYQPFKPMSSAGPEQSKPKKKQKKSQEMIQLQGKVQLLMKQNLQLQMTVNKLNDNAIIMKKSQIYQQKTHKQQFQKRTLYIDKLQTLNKAKDERIQELTNKKNEIQIQKSCMNYQIQKLKKQMQQYQLSAKEQYEQLKKYTQTQVKRYEQMVSEYQTAINQRVQYLAMNHSLQQQLQTNKQQQKRQIADKDREKLQTIDFIRKQMHQKAKQLKSNLLSIRRDQMATNTRITVLQNQQLMEELQYQSKHTQNTIKQNMELEKKVETLTKQLQVEKEIVQELAKRSTISRNIIKTLSIKNNTLQKSVEQLGNKDNLSSKKKTFKQSTQKNLLQRECPSKQASQQTLKSLSQTITHLQNQLIQYQQKLAKLQKEKNHFKQIYQQNNPKFQYYLKKQSDLRLLMIRFLSNALEGRLIGEQGDVQYDISRLRDVAIENWSQTDVDITLKMLLTYLKPHFSVKNMQADYIKHNKWQIPNQDSIDQLILNQKHRQTLIQTKIKKQIQAPPNNSRLKKIIHSKNKSFSTFNLNPSLNQSNSKGNASANVSPQKISKESSLYSALQEFKRKSLLKKDKTFSHHNTSQPYLLTAQISKSKHVDDMKENYYQKLEFRPQQFKKEKQMPKLIRANIRDWGKKVQLSSRGAFLIVSK